MSPRSLSCWEVAALVRQNKPAPLCKPQTLCPLQGDELKKNHKPLVVTSYSQLLLLLHHRDPVSIQKLQKNTTKELNLQICKTQIMSNVLILPKLVGIGTIKI